MSIIMTQKVSKKGAPWLNHEIKALLEVWTNPEIQEQLSRRLHNMRIYENISDRLGERGVSRTGEQCREKIKKLRRDYKTVIDKNYSPSYARKVLVCYDKMHEIFGKPTTQPKINNTKKHSVVKNQTIKVHDLKFSNEMESPNLQEGKGTVNPDNYSQLDIKQSENLSLVLKDPEVDLQKKNTKPNISTVADNLEQKCIENLIEKQSVLFQRIQKQHSALHNRYLAKEKSRFQSELSRQREKIQALETRRQKNRENKIKLFSMMLDSMVSKHKLKLSINTRTDK